MIVRTDKIRDCFSMTGVLKPILRVFVTDDADVKKLTGYSAGSEAVNIATKTKWMLRPDGLWHKVGSEDTVNPGTTIYGVRWTIGASNKLTRTDAAAGFADPVPCLNGVGGSSPFDGLMPWAGMQIVEDELAGTLVSIPKFYYRITKMNGALSVQLADGPAEGFSVSPAHMDRGDGKGERDMVYIGRYKISMVGDSPETARFSSSSGMMPLANVSRAELREGARQMLGDLAGVYTMQDYAMFWTTRLLMLVEFATWDMQSAIGYGCGNGESVEATGSTDAMLYHTGTMGETRDTYCVGVQYRYIEDMWANVAEFIDGWRLDTNTGGVYVAINPIEYSDTEGGVMVGSIDPSTVNGFITDWAVPNVDGYSWAMIPASATMEGVETGTEYVADCCAFEGPALISGGNADVLYPGFGPFVLCGGPASVSGGFFGARLQKIP